MKTRDTKHKAERRDISKTQKKKNSEPLKKEVHHSQSEGRNTNNAAKHHES